MSELVGTAFGLLLVGVLAAVSGRGLAYPERRWIWLSAAAHALAAGAKVWVVFYYYRDGDMDSYIRDAQHIAALLRSDPGQWVWPYVKFGLHMDVQVPYLPPGETGPTRTVHAFAAFHQAVFGVTRLGVSLFVAAFSLASKVAVYRVFRDHLPARYRTRLAIAVLLIPSAVFWSSALSKEGILWMSCGWVLYGFHLAAFRGRPVAGGALMVVAGAATSLVKAYVLFPMAIGAAVWLYARATQRAPRTAATPLRTVLSAAAVFAATSLIVVGLSEAFPRYKLENFTEEAAWLQSRAFSVEQGSGYAIRTSDTVGGQLAAAPMAAITALYRPLIFEARNPLMFVNSIETTFFLLLTFYVLRERGLGVVATVMRSPALMFCTVYVLTFAVAVGLTSTNLGTLSRYRMPMMPYLGVLFAVVTPMARAPVPAPKRAPRRGATVVPLHTA